MKFITNAFFFQRYSFTKFYWLKFVEINDCNSDYVNNNVTTEKSSIKMALNKKFNDCSSHQNQKKYWVSSKSHCKRFLFVKLTRIPLRLLLLIYILLKYY